MRQMIFTIDSTHEAALFSSKNLMYAISEATYAPEVDKRAVLIIPLDTDEAACCLEDPTNPRLNPDLIPKKDVKQVVRRLLVAFNTAGNDFLVKLQMKASESDEFAQKLRDSKTTILTVDDALTNYCKQQGFTKVCVQRTSFTTFDEHLDARLAAHGLEIYRLTQSIGYFTRNYANRAVNAYDRGDSHDIVAESAEHFWKISQGCLVNAKVDVVFLDNRMAPLAEHYDKESAAPVIADIEAIYTKAITDWAGAPD